ncbi:S-adenosylmethionine:tRNA ribosyltransferase-isomerase [Leekyejoonella antrihumi]|uniref:S-adenosylmethionine:tRNA ribosyltransferase-isomerase n=1 Tax=Leekyejoonella antrihumi TaxID=1660198 RepID=A0A563DWA5_9MICO|nr:S-adenosylmethionine:tRNA ribosyltransferase-isomerase [Leekyejoonella antrihumi]TWP34568.1 S-adenosylmethionine:tRNA ribosyltransferase-isomerase [Leekyejoonella antrihumi]
MKTLSSTPTTHFPQPDLSIAPAPAEQRGLARDEVRLLVATPAGITHARFRDLPDQLVPGDLVVVNNSATVAGEIDARMDAGGRAGTKIVLHVAGQLDDGGWVVELRTWPDASAAILGAEPDVHLEIGDLTLTLLAPYPGEGSTPTGHGNRLWRATVDGNLRRALDEGGRPIAYGYLDRRYPLSAYQSVFATVPGSAEMPSAGRPFSQAVITRLVAAGVSIAPVTLHTGVSSQEAGEAPQTEWFEVPSWSAALLNATRAAGGRVIAVGTTVTRALESAVGADGSVHEARGWTDRVVSPQDPARVVDGLITGWHDPQASHLLLVESVAGSELTQAAYDAAVAQGYLWHEFGDSALLLRGASQSTLSGCDLGHRA